MELPTAFIRLRMSSADVHYGGGLVDGARMLEIFGDLITELAIKHDGDEGLFRAYESVDFVAPVYAGDFIEARGRMVDVGNTSRKCEFEAHKVARHRPDISESAAEMLEEPVLACKAVGITVVTEENQRYGSKG